MENEHYTTELSVFGVRPRDLRSGLMHINEHGVNVTPTILKSKRKG